MTTKQDLAALTFDLNPSAMVLSRLDGEVLEVNNSFQTILGYSKNEIVGRNTEQLGLFTDPQEWLRLVLLGKSRGRLHEIEVELRTKTGGSVWVLGAAGLVDYQGQQCLLTSFLEISRRKNLETDLLESRELFHVAFELSPSMMSIVRESDLKYLSVNQSFERGLGYTRNETVGHTSAELGMLVDDANRQKVLETVRTNGAYNDFEVQVRARSGAILDLWGSADTMTLNGQRCILALFFDITERKRAQLAWQHTQETRHHQAEGQAALLATLVEASDDAIIGKALDSTVVSWNRGAEQIFGYTAEEMVGQLITELVPEDRIDEEAYILGKIKAGHVVSRYETVRRHKGGHLLDVSLTVSPIRDHDGFVVGASKVARDITEHKRAENEILRFNQTLELKVAERTSELQIANEKLEAFAYAASHDLKAPLRVINNTTKWLEEDLEKHLTPDTRETMTQLRRRVGRMEKLLDDLLAYSKVGRVLDKDDLEIVTGDHLMTNILDMLAPPPHFAVKVDPNFAAIQVPRMPLQQILFNLINNAIKHHDKPQGVIEVTCADSPEFYLFAVKDDGPGIAPQFHERIFKMFETLKPREQVEGSGIGLALVERNVKIFGGRLSLDSAEGRGSVFRIGWPKQQKTPLL